MNPTDDNDLQFDELMDIMSSLGEYNKTEEKDPDIFCKEKANELLERRGLPDLDEILEVFYDAKPEYRL